MFDYPLISDNYIKLKNPVDYVDLFLICKKEKGSLVKFVKKRYWERIGECVFSNRRNKDKGEGKGIGKNLFILSRLITKRVSSCFVNKLLRDIFTIFLY